MLPWRLPRRRLRPSCRAVCDCYLRRLQVSEQTLEAPPVRAPVQPALQRRRPAPSVGELARQYPWAPIAVGLLILSTIIVLWARTRPGYDPYGWLVWGKLTIHLQLDTNGAPSWKPLPFLFTVPYAVVGHYALWLWMVTSVAISLSGLVFAWRIAFRLTGSPPERRYASYVAGLFAALLVLALYDPLLPANYWHYILSAESDTMIVSLCLAAIDAHLSGRHRLAFWLWWLGSLGRPEVWPFYGLAGLWLWFQTPSYRRWLYASLAGLAFLWFGIPGITSKSLLTAGNIAQNSPRAIHGNKITGTIQRFFQLEPTTMWILAGLTIAFAVRRRQRTILVLTAGALAWVLIEIAFALHGFPAVPRYMFEPGAVMAALAGVFVGRLILEVPPLLARIELPRINAAQLGSWGTALVVAVIAGSLAQAAGKQVRLERRDLTHERARTHQIGRLQTVVQRLGVSRILACGQPNIPIGYQSVLAWYMDVKIGILYVSPSYLKTHPHPLVNFVPVGNGWKVFPSNISTPAQTAHCHHLRLSFHS
jgi:hypothetical protein